LKILVLDAPGGPDTPKGQSALPVTQPSATPLVAAPSDRPAEAQTPPPTTDRLLAANTTASEDSSDGAVEPEKNEIVTEETAPPGQSQERAVSKAKALTRTRRTKPVRSPTEYGRITVITSPPTPAYLDGRNAGPLTSVVKKRSALVLGNGSEAVRVSLRVRGAKVLVRVEAPSGVDASFNGAPLGVAPTSPVTLTERGTFKFVLPSGRQLVAQLRFEVP
ncbi:MAG: hypothetical protein AAF658_12980, partial [Myxococcota bacterium]